MNQKVNNYIGQLKTWQEAIKSLRMIVLEFPLTEDLKWGKPCYSYKNTNIIIIHAFKEYCGLMFFKGSLLKNVKGLLVKPGENTQGGRLLKFFTAAKQSETRISRIEKYKKQILSGKGMNDCTCGLSQKMPYCDGSHKLLKTN